MLVHLGMSTDRELARIQYEEMLAAGAQARADRQRAIWRPSEAARLILLAGAVAGLVLVIWLVVAS